MRSQLVDLSNPLKCAGFWVALWVVASEVSRLPPAKFATQRIGALHATFKREKDGDQKHAHTNTSCEPVREERGHRKKRFAVRNCHPLRIEAS